MAKRRITQKRHVIGERL